MEKIKNIIKSSIAPTDRNALWLNTEDGVLYAFSVSGSNQGWVPSGSGGIESGDIEEVTYGELTAMMEAAVLVPGKKYRIIDYMTTTIQEDTISMGHQFDIIVTAKDKSTLEEQAKAANHKFENQEEHYIYGKGNGRPPMLLAPYYVFQRVPYLDKYADNPDWPCAWVEIYSLITEPTLSELPWITSDAQAEAAYSDGMVMFNSIASEEEASDQEIRDSFIAISKVLDKGVYEVSPIDCFRYCVLDMWELLYSTDNGGWSDPDNGKGIIHYLKDEYGNEAYYDFKNIGFNDGEGTYIPTFLDWDGQDASLHGIASNNSLLVFEYNDSGAALPSLTHLPNKVAPCGFSDHQRIYNSDTEYDGESLSYIISDLVRRLGDIENGH